MALYHFSIDQVRRSAGQSAIAAAAYRAGERLYSDYYGEVSDYTKKGGVICSEIFLPPNAPKKFLDRKFCPQKLIQSIHTGLLFSNSSMTPPQVRPPPNPTATTRLPGPIRPRSCSSLKARGMLAAEVFP